MSPYNIYIIRVKNLIVVVDTKYLKGIGLGPHDPVAPPDIGRLLYRGGLVLGGLVL
jgi:hypothetical protein